MDGGVSRISISLPPDLLREFDEVIRAAGYEDRSKAIQAAMRGFIAEHKWSGKLRGTGVGAIVMVYDHRVRGLQQRLTGKQHRFEEVIGSTMHIHLDRGNCLEIIAVRGDVEEIRALVRELEGERGVKQLRLSLVQT